MNFNIDNIKVAKSDFLFILKNINDIINSMWGKYGNRSNN